MVEQTANIILGKAGPYERFTLRYGILTFHLGIKPITAKRLVMIGKQLSKIGKIDNDMFQALIDGTIGTKYIARSIAIATGTRFPRIVTSAIMNLPNKDICTLFKIVRKQSDPEPYFFFMVLARGRMNILNPTKDKQ